jgi:tRNA (uracil-5-)-methyltransferase
VLYHDVLDFLGSEYTTEVLARGDGSEWDAPENLELMSIVELAPAAMTVSGGLFYFACN